MVTEGKLKGHQSAGTTAPPADISNLKAFKLLGMPMCAMTLQDWLQMIAAAVSKHRGLVICHYNMHAAFWGQKEEDVRRLWETAVGYIDGMALVFLGKFLSYPLQRENRLTGVDWTGPLMREAAERGWRVFFLGGRPGVAESAAEKLRKAYPGLSLETHHGYFDQRSGALENEAVVQTIQAARPDVLLVGLGMPRQEKWLFRNHTRISCGAMIACGAVMDYIAGEIPTPPRWMGRWGLEWLYRFVCEPRRLFGRYFIEPWFLIGPFMKDLQEARRRRRDERRGVK